MRRRSLPAALVAPLVLLSLVAGLAVARAVLVDVVRVGSASMEPLLRQGDVVLAWRPGGVPDRGDVVVLEPDALPTGSDRALVKRVVGLPGERVACCTPDGRLSVDGEPLAEPYVYPGEVASALAFDVEVPAGRLWVLGDHRSASRDSRDHLGAPGGGMVRVDRIVGRLLLRVHPPDRWGVLVGGGR